VPLRGARATAAAWRRASTSALLGGQAQARTAQRAATGDRRPGSNASKGQSQQASHRRRFEV